MRPTLLTAAALTALVFGLAACGTAAGPPPGPAVSLHVTAPDQDSRVSATSATVSGTVRPARAKVLVLGAPVTVGRDGSFSTRIALSVGANLIDVVASAPRSVGAVTAVRVTRFLLVTIPQLIGQDPSTAASALRSLGLSVKTVASSDPFGFLLPSSVKVCSTTPGDGSRVNPGSTVTLHTSKLCGF